MIHRSWSKDPIMSAAEQRKSLRIVEFQDENKKCIIEILSALIAFVNANQVVSAAQDVEVYCMALAWLIISSLPTIWALWIADIDFLTYKLERLGISGLDLDGIEEFR